MELLRVKTLIILVIHYFSEVEKYCLIALVMLINTLLIVDFLVFICQVDCLSVVRCRCGQGTLGSICRQRILDRITL